MSKQFFCKTCGRGFIEASDLIIKIYEDTDECICTECLEERADIVMLVDYKLVFAKYAAILIVDIISGELNYRGIDYNDISKHLTTTEVAGLCHILTLNEITLMNARKVIQLILDHEVDRLDSIKDIVTEFDLLIKDTGDTIDIAIQENPKAVCDYKAGNHKAINAIMGAVMKSTGGTADPKETIKLIRERLA